MCLIRRAAHRRVNGSDGPLGGPSSRREPKRPRPAWRGGTARMGRRGRRPGPDNTREDVLAAARELFAQRGLRATTMRAVAAQAGVNPAMIHHYFGTKEQLFVAALAMPIDPAAEVARLVAAGPRDQLGDRVVRFFVETWRNPATG